MLKSMNSSGSGLNKQIGFTLMEALVALVILSVVFSAVWSWFNTAVLSTEKIEQKIALPRVFDQFIDHLSLVSLRQSQEGEVLIDGYVLKWQATPSRQSVNEYYERLTAWHLVLFNVTVDVYKSNEKLTSWQTKQTAYWRKEQAPRN